MDDPITDPIRITTESLILAIQERCSQCSSQPELERASLPDPNSDIVPATWFNWYYNSVGFVIEDDELVLLEMTRKHLLLADKSSVDSLMTAVDTAIAKNTR